MVVVRPPEFTWTATWPTASVPAQLPATIMIVIVSVRPELTSRWLFTQFVCAAALTSLRLWGTSPPNADSQELYTCVGTHKPSLNPSWCVLSSGSFQLLPLDCVSYFFRFCGNPAARGGGAHRLRDPAEGGLLLCHPCRGRREGDKGNSGRWGPPSTQAIGQEVTSVPWGLTPYHALDNRDSDRWRH